MNGGQGGMRMPQNSLPQDVEVLSEADLAAEGLLTFAALANLTASELMAAAKKFNVTTSQQEDLPRVIQKILTAQAEEQGQVWARILEIVRMIRLCSSNGPSGAESLCSSPMLRRIGLRQRHDWCVIAHREKVSKFWGMLRVEIISGRSRVGASPTTLW